MSKENRIYMPPKLQFLFQPIRHKVAFGGRGSGKSWSFARALLLLAATKRMRVVCLREVQKSIKDSVHALLSDQIKLLGLENFYEVIDTEIRGRNGTSFLFAGLSTQTDASIKSFEGADVAWVEEAQTVRKRSWQILLPTIRKPGSEIWVSFNPHLDTDDTYRRFVVDTPPDSCVQEINYMDNPYFSDVMEQERQHCEVTEPDDYPNIWLGKCRVAVEGAIYAKEIETAVREGRVSHCPYDPRLKAHCVWDLGWNDSMSIIVAQRMRSEVRIINYLEDDHKTLDWYVAEIKKLNYNWGYDFLPHDGYHEDYKTGKTAAAMMKSMGRVTRKTPDIGREAGIKIARSTLAATVFNKPYTGELVEHLKRYKRAINKATEEEGAPVHDAHSHGADAYRYLGLVTEMMTNEDDDRPLNIPRKKPSVPGMLNI